MKPTVLTTLALTALAFSTLRAADQPAPPAIQKITANLYVDDVQACVKFWVDRLGFARIKEVPDGKNLAFALLKKGDLDLMYGSYASLNQEPQVKAAYHKGTAFLYIIVGDLDPIVAAMQGAELVAPVHTTPYGERNQRQGSGRQHSHLRAVHRGSLTCFCRPVNNFAFRCLSAANEPVYFVSRGDRRSAVGEPIQPSGEFRTLLCNVCVRQSFDPREGYHVALSLRKQVLRAPEILFRSE
jgi:catechol 2,3-dioxygenase-like lactoylglutathione lyase family enzyme